jgi:hypothetical protein
VKEGQAWTKWDGSAAAGCAAALSCSGWHDICMDPAGTMQIPTSTRPKRDLTARGPRSGGIVAALRRTIAAERQLLSHPVFGMRAAHVMVRARADLALLHTHDLRRR